jgi:hypothetical protein
MDITRAFSIIFEDHDWSSKVAIAAIVTLLSALLTPVIIGLAGWAILLGYATEIIRNVRGGSRTPLPRWDDFSRLLSIGLPVLVASIVYGLPSALLTCCGWFLLQSSEGTTFVGSSVALGVGCCVFPLLLIYNIVALPMFALGLGRYTEDPRTQVFFEFNTLFDLFRTNTDPVFRWLINVLIATLIFAVLAVIPCLGWVIGLALIVPIHGILVGQFAARVFGGKPKNDPLRAPAPRR